MLGIWKVPCPSLVVQSLTAEHNWGSQNPRTRLLYHHHPTLMGLCSLSLTWLLQDKEKL